MDNQKLLNLKNLNSNIRTLSDLALKDNWVDFTQKMVALEDVTGSIGYDEIPTGTVYEKINELNKIIAGRQAGMLLEAIKTAKSYIEEYSELGTLENRQSELDSINEKLNLSMKSQVIPQFHTLSEQARQSLLETIQQVFKLDELPSIDVVNDLIELYNKGATKNIIKNKLGVVLKIDDPEISDYSKEMEQILNERVIKYIFFRLTKFNEVVEKIDFYNEITAPQLTDCIDWYLAEVSEEKELAKVIAELVEKSSVPTLESHNEAIAVTSVDQNTINYIKAVFKLVDDNKNLDLFLRLNDPLTLKNILGDSPSTKEIYNLSTKYNALLDSLIITVQAAALAASVLKCNLKIVSAAIDAGKTLNEMLDNVYNSILQVVNSNVSTESFGDNHLSRAPKLSKPNNDLTNVKLISENNVILRARVQHYFDKHGLMSIAECDKFINATKHIFRECYGVNIQHMKPDEVKGLLYDSLEILPNNFAVRYNNTLNETVRALELALANEKDIPAMIGTVRQEVVKLLSNFNNAIENAIKFDNIISLKTFIKENVDSIYGRPLYNSVVWFHKELNITNVRQVLPFMPENQILSRFQYISERVGTQTFVSSEDIKVHLISKPQVFNGLSWYSPNDNYLFRMANSADAEINNLVESIRFKIDVITDKFVEKFGEQTAIITKRKMLQNIVHMTAMLEAREINDILTLIKAVINEDMSSLVYATATCNEIYSIFLSTVKGK